MKKSKYIKNLTNKIIRKNKINKNWIKKNTFK